MENVTKEFKTKYPITELEVNQSVTIEGLRNRIAVICSTYGKKTGKKFATKKTDEESKFQVTRTA